MPSAVAARRREIFAAARQAPADFLRFDASRLRFTLGATPGDPRIPVWLAGDATGIVRGAAADLALLLATSHRHFVPADDLDRLVMSEGYAALPMAAPTLGPSGGGADLRAASSLGLEGHPALTGGLLCAWMGPGGRGRSLTGLWIEVMRQALAEMAACGGREETPLVAAVALYAELLAAADASRDRLPGPPVDRYLRAAQGVGLWVAARTGVLRAWREAGRAGGDPLLLRLEAVVAPAPLLGRGGRLGGATLYGCELSAGLPRGEDQVSRLALGADAAAAAGDVAAALLADEELARRASAAVATARLRTLLVQATLAAEVSGHGDRLKSLRALVTSPEGLVHALAEEPARRELRRTAADGEALPGETGQVLAEAARALKGYRPRDPALSFGFSREAACREYGEVAAAVYADAALERMLAPARRAVAPRTGQEAEGGAEAEWEAGRLYRITARGGPILLEGTHQPVGHLFCDVMDFTRRTGLLGPATMAEFLRTEFYGPILASAKRFYRGMGHLADKGGVTMNNLLGDAITFSGDIESLVALAQEIRRILAEYQERLRREVSTEAVARDLGAIEERYRADVAALRREEAAAREAMARAAPGSGEQLEALARVARSGDEEARLASERERALARARGQGLEAGVFLSFGAAPLVVLIDDEVFGANRVAVADKINESARGTARVPLARARADAELEAERAVRGHAGLEHAWRVFVDSPLTVTLPPQAERAALALAQAGALDAAVRAASGPVRQALEAAARGLAAEEPGEVYNSGAALSQEALDAFLAAVEPERSIREVVLDPEAIPGELRARWYFGRLPQPLVATFHPDGRPAELFRRVGRAAFKGLGEVPVWELCEPAGAPAELARALGHAWLQGAPA
ncbi:MAG TPA: hypothetical protein VH880_15355 [Anaeromyxobacteraceae bacterium]|jgi:hypothetical protein